MALVRYSRTKAQGYLSVAPIAGDDSPVEIAVAAILGGNSDIEIEIAAAPTNSQFGSVQTNGS